MTTPSPRVRLHTLGCRLNEAELETWSARFGDHGLCVVDDDGAADLIVINTCAVTQEAVRKSRQLLRRSRRAAPHARVIVSGCQATLEAELLARQDGIDLVIGNADKERLVERALALLDWTPALRPAEVRLPQPVIGRPRQRAFVKVQDGCRYRCTFCVTTRARGAEWSRPSDAVIDEVRMLVQGGVREIVLAGVHLAGYGHQHGEDLALLIRRLLVETDIARLRLGSLEPWDLPAGFWTLFADSRLMPHLHLPVQSGSDPILRRMARRCASGDFARLLDEGRSRVPELEVSTDIIAGFPGEREDDWRRTLIFAEAMAFSGIHVFRYSARPGTLAATLSDQVEMAVRKRRCAELQQLAGGLTRARMQRQLGREAEVLVEGTAASAGRTGYTPGYLPVRVLSEQPLTVNRIVRVNLEAVDDANGILLARASG